MLKTNGRHRNALRWLGRTALLSATLAILFATVGYSDGSFIGALVCLAYIVSPIFLYRELRNTPDVPSKGAGMLLVCGLSGASAALALGIAAPLLWLANAYRWDVSGAISGLSFLSAAANVIPGNYTNKVGMAVILLLVAALLLSLALALRPKLAKKGVRGGPAAGAPTARRQRPVLLADRVRVRPVHRVAGHPGQMRG